MSQTLLDGSIAHLPAAGNPGPADMAMWSSWVGIGADGDPSRHRRGATCRVASVHGRLRAAAVLSPAVAPDVLAMPFGQGHTHFTRYASGRGANPFTVLASSSEPETGTLAWAATRVKLTRLGGPDDSLVLFAGATRERPEEAVGR